MKINEWDIANAEGKQWHIEVGHLGVANTSEWTPNSALPFFLSGNLKLKTLKVDVNVYGKDREAIIHNRSLLLSKLINVVVLDLDDYQNKFLGILSKHSEAETSMNRWHKVSLEFLCIEYGDEITETFDVGEFSINNTGNVETPVIIEILPKENIGELTIEGLCRDRITKESLSIIIKNLTQGKKVVIDVESELILEEDELKSKDVELWEATTLLPEENMVKVSGGSVKMTLRYKPYFM